jgi:asparagine synthase (glutamine-hydrolysing)
MCGLAAVVCQAGDFPDPKRLQSVVEELRHRGPDDSGSENFHDQGISVCLIHTRLSIIDLTQSGHQPFQSSDGKWRLLFNGEIYNYLELRQELRALGINFESQSDTEVLLWAWRVWGTGALGKLRGMFSFVVLDLEEKSMLAVRDPFGIKPLFMGQVGSGWGFASEIRALRTMSGTSARMNHQVAYKYLTSGVYDAGSETFFSGVSALPPGHLAVVGFSSGVIDFKVVRWFERPSTSQVQISWENAKDSLRHKMEQSVRLHLRADVGLGVALSGGLDSSVLTALIRKIEPEAEINTFSFVSPGSQSDESYWSNAVATHLGTKQHLVAPTGEQVAQDIDDVVYAQGEPFGSLSIYAQYAIYRTARDSGLKVVIDGQGGDEAFAGYFGYPEARVRSLLKAGDLTGAISLLRNWSGYPKHKLSNAIASLLGTYLEGNPSLIALVRSTSSKVDPWLKTKVFSDYEIAPGQIALENLLTQGPIEHRYLTKRLSSALFSGEMLNLLRHGDRNSMRWSVESRVPYLDLDLVSLAQSLPEQYLLSKAGETKSILRHAMRGLLPDEVLFRRDKVGFEAPDLQWIRQMSDRAPALTEGLEKIAWIDNQIVNQKLQEVLDGKRAYSNVFWRLVNLAKWAKFYL